MVGWEVYCLSISVAILGGVRVVLSLSYTMSFRCFLCSLFSDFWGSPSLLAQRDMCKIFRWYLGGSKMDSCLVLTRAGWLCDRE